LIRKRKKFPHPTVEQQQEPERERGNTVPFIPYDDSSMNPHIYRRRRPTAVVLDPNSQVFSPLLNNRGKTVRYVNFGFSDCPELAWIRDVADAGKHCGLGRPTLEVREVVNTWPLNTTPLTITLDDGRTHDFADVLSRVIEYWRTKHFP
jgi:hypothetical protein